MINIHIIDDIKLQLEKFSSAGKRITCWRKFDQSERVSLVGGQFDMYDSTIYYAHLANGWIAKFNTSQFTFITNG